MSGIFKKVMYIAIGLLVVMGLLTELIPDIATDAAALAVATDTPAILAVIVNYWWIGLTVVFLGVIMGAKAFKKRRSRRRGGY